MSITENFDFKRELLNYTIQRELSADGNNLAALTGRYAVEMLEEIIKILDTPRLVH